MWRAKQSASSESDWSNSENRMWLNVWKKWSIHSLCYSPSLTMNMLSWLIPVFLCHREDPPLRPRLSRCQVRVKHSFLLHDKSVSAHCTQPALSLSLVNTETSVSSFNHLQQSCLLLLPRHREEEPVVGLVIVVVLKLHLVACRVSHAAQLLQHEASLHLRLGLLPVHQAVLPWRLFVHTGW